MDIVVVGSCNTDFSSYVSHLPLKGETLTGHKFETGFGGKGANQCIAAVKLGARTAMVGKLGDDIFGDQYFNSMRANNVNCTHLKQVGGASSGVASIFVGDDGSNCIVIVPGANNLLDANDVADAEDLIKSSKLVVCQNEIPQETTLAALKLAKKHGVKTIFNPAPAQKDFDPELFKVPDFFCPNETEACHILQIFSTNKTLIFASLLLNQLVNDPETAMTAARQLVETRGCNSVIITLGEKGAVYLAGKDAEPEHIPTSPVRAVDTTGAGDSFIGSLAFFMTTRPDLPIEEMIKRAGQIAAESVQKPGTQKSFPFASDLPSHILA
ncbi:unnamed protein product [Lymnaea stagnalis]|uniref:Ribokinase n=1 Tax=Lymnaea stagnalis TaxID=6523 RepID=A0AAV2H9L7_LYMST